MSRLFLFVFIMITLPWFGLSAFCQGSVDSTGNGIRISKGMYFASGTVSLGDRKAENEDQLFVYVVNQKKNKVEIRLDGGYIIKDNLGVGLGVLYGTASENNQQKTSDGALTSNKIAEKYYALRPFVKNFIPLGKAHRFYIVIPTELQIGYGSKIKESTTNGVLTRTYTTTNYYGLAMRPGILAFIYKNFGFEVNVGAFGLNTSVEKTTKTDMPESRIKTNDLDLKINILNLSLGFSAYF